MGAAGQRRRRQAQRSRRRLLLRGMCESPTLLPARSGPKPRRGTLRGMPAQACGPQARRCGKTRRRPQSATSDGARKAPAGGAFFSCCGPPSRRSALDCAHVCWTPRRAQCAPHSALSRTMLCALAPSAAPALPSVRQGRGSRSRQSWRVQASGEDPFSPKRFSEAARRAGFKMPEVERQNVATEAPR